MDWTPGATPESHLHWLAASPSETSHIPEQNKGANITKRDSEQNITMTIQENQNTNLIKNRNPANP